MAEKSTVMDISPDSWDSTKTKRKRLKLMEEEGTPVRAIFCLKSRDDLKRYEETEDCFILGFDPFDPLDIRELSFSDDDDVAIIHEKGQVACRDDPHPRHLCLKFPFGTTPHSTHCSLCCCYVCDLAAPCGSWLPHCDASEHIETWKHCRETRKLKDSSKRGDTATCN